MALVDYSDSEESGDDQTNVATKVPPPKPAQTPNSNFKIDRANPQRIQVRLNDAGATNGTHDDEPAAKRPRLGAGGFSGFNAMLPPPKRNNEKLQSGNKPPARKVFSLKTGAEPGFSRESDAELRQFFAEQEAERTSSTTTNMEDGVGIPNIQKKNTESTVQPTEQSVKGNVFMFKPLSVARNTKKKKPASSIPRKQTASEETASRLQPVSEHKADPPAKKVSLFSSNFNEPASEEVFQEPEPPDASFDTVDGTSHDEQEQISQPPASSDPDPQSLDTIASDLNLSAAERRQLFGRGGKGATAAALNVVNFNTDAEYAANEELRSAGEQQQHNPLRAIAPGKHSLKQLVSNAQGQKDALEESFASGRRNKKEAGNKYGW